MLLGKIKSTFLNSWRIVSVKEEVNNGRKGNAHFVVETGIPQMSGVRCHVFSTPDQSEILQPRMLSICKSSRRAFGGTVIVSDPHKPALRIFTCKHCGEEVRVTEENDMRTKFCSQRCENLYWKHSKRAQRGKKESRSFHCRNCGKEVIITDSHDRRSVFCSKECSVKWHSQKKKGEKDA